MQVRVFRNLTRRCYSIQARIPRKGWRTVAHADAVELISARFHVSDAGRARVLRTGKKTVHAWVQGRLSAWAGKLSSIDPGYAVMDGLTAAERDLAQRRGERVRYVPRLAGSFILAGDGPVEPIHAASYVYLDSNGVQAIA